MGGIKMLEDVVLVTQGVGPRNVRGQTRCVRQKVLDGDCLMMEQRQDLRHFGVQEELALFD
jgi:hypothetical protein